jgi:uncharacterized phiE125 gp8 family phage protein
MLISTRVTRTEPSTEPVTVDELRAHLRMSVKTHDSDLSDYITTARQVIEEAYLSKALIDQAVVEYFDTFADGMELRWAPVDSVTSVQYLDTDGDSQTLAATVYELGDVLGQGVVRLKYDQVFPSIRAHADVVWITYTAGYGAKADVPKAIRRAILLYAGSLHTGVLPTSTIDSLLSPYRDRRVI